MNGIGQNPVLNNPLPSLDGGKGVSAQMITQEQRAKLDKIINAPSSLSGRSLIGKVIIGLVIWAIMSVMLFFVMSLFGLTLQETSGSTTGVGITNAVHPLAWLILLFLGLVITVAGNQLLLFVFWVLFSEKYRQKGKTSGLLLLSNTILFAMMIGLFVIFQDMSWAPALLFAFYVCFALFLSFAQMEFVVNPNYSASSLAGCTIGFMISLIVLWAMWKASFNTVESSSQYIVVLIASLVSFPLMIFGEGLWEIVYSKIYEMGANPFYLPSQAELDTQTIIENQQKEAATERVNVDF